MPTISGAGMPDGSPLARITLARVARLATVRPDGTPHAVPITFAIVGETVVTAIDFKPKKTTNLQRLQNLRANPAVSVVVDHYDENWSGLWWVRLDGRAEVVGDGREYTAAIDALVSRYPQYRDNVPVGPAIIVRPTRWTAWSAITATADE